MIGPLPADVFLQNALLPMVALEVMIVVFYIIFAIRIWPGMPWREAVIYAPLAVPLGFLIFFLVASTGAGSRPIASLIGPLALVTVLPWLAGIAAGAITYWRVKRRRN